MSLLHQVALTFIKNVGPTLAKSLLTHFGSAEQIFKTPAAKLVSVPRLGEKKASDLGFSAALERAEQSFKSGIYLDQVTEEVRSATEALEELIPKTPSEGILREIFARFCIGK